MGFIIPKNIKGDERGLLREMAYGCDGHAAFLLPVESPPHCFVKQIKYLLLQCGGGGGLGRRGSFVHFQTKHSSNKFIDMN